jgi:ribonucleotide reductase alpha subunit
MKRKGSIAIYLEPWHLDIFDFLDLRKNQGKEEMRARDLFLALWTNDIFMERVDLDENWTLMCPHECPGLNETFGEEFNKLYLDYEKRGYGKKTIKARELWNKILESQVETGTPYILYKDAINEKSNQANIGIVRSSNLCVDGETLIKCLVDGIEKEISIKLLDSLFKSGSTIEVLSRNTTTHENEWCFVENSGMTNENAETIRISDDSDNYVICTPDHQIWTHNRGYVRAGDLTENDILQLVERKIERRANISKIESAYNRPVYDITVSNNHNFYANNILVHNCAEILEVSGITKIQKEILNNEELLKSLGLSEFIGEESVNETAVCNLASISLSKFVNKNKTYNYNKLYDVAYQATTNLNNVIDVNYYPSKSAKFSNLLHRPIGLGVQGLSDVFFQMGLPYESDEAKFVNKQIFETIYFAAVRASCDLSMEQGPYSTFKGSPLSEGKFQFDLWKTTPSDRWNWNKLREDVIKFGVRNSLTTCIMPTASTSSILGNEASVEAQTSNLYLRRVISGEFIIVNKYLVKELVKLGIWNDNIKNKIIQQNGSILNIAEIPNNIKEVYRTVWEIKQKSVIEMAADRGAFIDQTQSMNIFMEDTNFGKLTSMHFYGWGKRTFSNDENGQPIIPIDDDKTQVVYDQNGVPKFYRQKSTNLKTGMYYLRTKSAADAVKFTVQEAKTPESIVSKTVEEQMSDISCSLSDPDNCISCGS